MAVLLAALPIYLESFWLQTGLFAMAAIIAAIGLTILVGTAGPALARHAFFVAIGAYGYCFLAGEACPAPTGPPASASRRWSRSSAPCCSPGLAGALFSPISGRVRGIYLGLASLGPGVPRPAHPPERDGDHRRLRGVAVPPFSLFGFSFSTPSPDRLVILGVPFGRSSACGTSGSCWSGCRCGTGATSFGAGPVRALATMRDSEVAAATMGVDVVRYKAAAFTVSSMYAGLGGVLMALAFGRIVPESFGFLLSVDFLVMIVIGGAGSVGGAAAGAVFVTALPLVLNHYSGSLPLLAEPGSGGVGAAEFSRLVYGAAIVAVLLFARDGLAGLVRGIRKEKVA